MCPTLAGYLAFLYGPVAIPAGVYPSVQGTASAGSTNSLTDSTQSWTANQWVNYQLSDTTQGLHGLLSANTSNEVTTAVALPAAVNAGDAYLIALPSLLMTYCIALDIVNEVLACTSPDLYTLAVYNLGADRLFNFGQDIPNQTFFADKRGNDSKVGGMRLQAPSVGVSSSVNDGGTAVGILNPEALKTLTMLDLQTLKTPWGRNYMGIAQNFGNTMWGLT